MTTASYSSHPFVILKDFVERGEKQSYEESLRQEGKRQAYQEVMHYLARLCPECGKHLWNEEELKNHIAGHQPPQPT